MVKGVIFDLDGTLVISNDAHAESWARAFREFGFDVAFEDIRPLIGLGGDKLMPQAIEIDSESELGKKISKYRTGLFQREYLPGLEPTRGARDLVERLEADGYRLAIATSAQEDELVGLLKAADVYGVFHETTSSSDVEESKPDPDVIHAAMDKLGQSRDAVIMIGDTPYDVEASKRAGIRSIALRCGGWKDADLHDATAIYDDPADLLQHLEHSPIKD